MGFTKETPDAIAVLPLRAGSVSIPNKNFKDFCGRPLFTYQLAALAECQKISNVFIYTDIPKQDLQRGFSLIDQKLKKSSVSKISVIARPAEVSDGLVSTEETVLRFLQDNPQDEEVPLVIAQATNPFFTPMDYFNALSMYGERTDMIPIESILSGVNLRRFFWIEDEQSGYFSAFNYEVHYRPMRQQFDSTGQHEKFPFKVFLENGGFYSCRRIASFIRSGCRLIDPVGGYDMVDWFKGVEIDEPEDWDLIEHIFEKKFAPNVKNSLFL